MPSALGLNPYEMVVESGMGDNKYGRNPAQGTADWESCWTLGGDYPWPAAPAVTTAVSSDPTDTMAMELYGTLGPDDNWEAVVWNFNLTGTTPVVCPENLYRTFRMRPLNGDTPAGAVQGLIDGVVTIQVLAGRGSTEMLVFTVPGGIGRLDIPGVQGSTDGNKGAYFELWARPPGRIWRNESHMYISEQQGVWYDKFEPTKNYPVGTDLEVRCLADLAGEVSARTGGLFKNELKFRVI